MANDWKSCERHDFHSLNNFYCRKCGVHIIDLIDNLYENNRQLQQNATAEQSRADNAEQMLKRANEALERAGSAARFGTKIKIPEGAIVFIDTIETLTRDWLEDEPVYSQRQWDKQQKTIAALNVALETCINRLEFLDSSEARFYRSSNKFWIDTTKSLLQVVAREGEQC